MTKELDLSDQAPGGMLAAELTRLEGQGSLSADLKRLERETLSISSLVSSQLATHSIAADVGRLYSDRMENIARDVRHSLELMESNVARATSALAMVHSDASSRATRTLEITGAAHALEVSKQVEQIAKSLDFTKQFELIAKSLDFTPQFEQVRGTFDYVKDMEAAARSIIDGVNLNIPTATAAALSFESILGDLRASTAISALSTGQLAADGVLHLSTVPEAVREVVQRYVSEASVSAVLQPAPAAAPTESAVPTDYVWDRWLKQQPAWVQILVMVLVVWVLLAIVEAFWHVQVERWLSSHTQEARTQLVIEVQHDFGLDYLSRLRYAKGALHVRDAPSTDAPIVDRLSAGQPVELLEPQGIFSYIRYRDPTSGQIREGWAASGFLVKIVRADRTNAGKTK